MSIQPQRKKKSWEESFHWVEKSLYEQQDSFDSVIKTEIYAYNDEH